MTFNATKTAVVHGKSQSRDIPPDAFLYQLVEWARNAPAIIFATNNEPHDVFSSVFHAVGPWDGVIGTLEWFRHRRAAMCEVMRVLGAFESTWNWNEGKDQASHSENDAETMSAGLWQISYNSRHFGADLREMLANHGVKDGVDFQHVMKNNHPFCMEYSARLFRHMTKHNGPLLRHEVDGQISRSAVNEFKELLA